MCTANYLAYSGTLVTDNGEVATTNCKLKNPESPIKKGGYPRS